MKKILALTASLVIASHAMAQAVTPNAPEPAATTPITVPAPMASPAVPVPASAPAAPAPGNTMAPAANGYAAPSAPTAPVVPPVTMAPAGVSAAPAAATAQPLNLNAMVGKLAGNSNSQQQLGQVMVIGSIMGCTQKAAGKPATDAFYQQMQGLGKTVEGYCKQGNAALARTTVLSTLSAKHNDPVVTAMLACYDSQSATVAQLGGQQVATDAAHYARWLKDPEAAKAEMQESDVCRKGKPASAK